jgi:Transglycosylase SLT domain
VPISMNDPQFQAFLSAEMEQESGGNANAISPQGALGLFQIMPANIPEWSKQVLGYSITAAEFLANPAIQRTIAGAKLLAYVNQYGYQGAAAAWYAGPAAAKDYASTKPVNGGAGTIANYVNSVMARMSKLGQTVTSGSSGNSGSIDQNLGLTSAFGASSNAAIPSAQPTFDWFAGVGGGVLGGTSSQGSESIGLIQAFIGNDPELQNLYSEAVAGSWSQDQFVSQLQETNWWKTNSQSARTALALKTTDPSSFNQGVANTAAEVQQEAASLGVPLTAAALQNVAQTATIFGYDSSQIQQMLATYLTTLKGGQFGGYAGQVQLALKEYSADMGIPVSDQYVNNAVSNVTSGAGSLQAYRAWIQTQAQMAFPAYADQINAGVTVGQIAQPYAVALSQILEQDPDSIDLNNPLLRNVLTSKDQTGTPTITSLTDYENQLRTNPAWTKTNNARESMMSVANSVLSDMGLAANDLGGSQATSLPAATTLSPRAASQATGLGTSTPFTTLQNANEIPTAPSGTEGGPAAELAPDTSFTTAGTPQS